MESFTLDNIRDRLSNMSTRTLIRHCASLLIDDRVMNDIDRINAIMSILQDRRDGYLDINSMPGALSTLNLLDPLFTLRGLVPVERRDTIIRTRVPARRPSSSIGGLENDLERLWMEGPVREFGAAGPARSVREFSEARRAGPGAARRRK